MTDERTTCEDVEAALSARLDGEDPGLSASAIDAHVVRCARCRAFARDLSPARGLVPVAERSTTGSPDLSGAVTAAAGPLDRAGVWWLLRALLGLVAAGYLITAVPELLFTSDPHHAHLARHLGAFEAAYGVALLFVAVRPAKARAMVPFTLTLAAVMAVAMVVDLVNGNAAPLTELSHVLEIAGLLLVWALATRRGWPGRHDLRSGGPSGGADPGVEPRPLPPRPALVVAPDSGRTRVPRQRVG